MKTHFTSSPEQINTVQPWAALVGNPNCGKTAIFNLMTGLNQKVSNYPGVTVEKKIGNVKTGLESPFKLLDLPGTYSLTPESFDERIVSEQILDWIHGENPPAVIVSVIDASNLSRNLYLTSQLLDLGIPVVAALNMMDRLPEENPPMDLISLREKLGTQAIIPLSAKERWGINELKSAIVQGFKIENKESEFPLKMDSKIENALQPLIDFMENKLGYKNRIARGQALRLTTRKSALEAYEGINSNFNSGYNFQTLTTLRNETVETLKENNISYRTLEANLRYQFIDGILEDINGRQDFGLDRKSRSEEADQILTHSVFGPLIFVGILYFIFQSIFTWAALPMDWIGRGVHWFSLQLINFLPSGLFRDILVEGVMGGVGAIIVFLPQILILVFFLAILEDSGYMARVAFMLDRLMRSVGLHGRSVLPLMSGYACAIPGIMATRTIDSWKERLITILILPLMSCSARLPIYALMIGAFIPAITIWGVFNLQGLTLVGMYFLGTFTALLLAKIFSRFINTKGTSSFVMELPPYHIPLFRSVLRQVYVRGKLFILNAGKIIMAISILLWFLASYPKVEVTDQNQNPIHNSYAGKIGHAMEPLIKPLGFDWKIGIGLLTSFAAREVVVSTLATIYNVENTDNEIVNLSTALKNDRDPVTGLPVYTPLTALALMVFYVFAAQCMATFAIVRNETNSWRWPLFMIFYMTSLAWIAAFIVYQGGLIIGLG